MNVKFTDAFARPFEAIINFQDRANTISVNNKLVGDINSKKAEVLKLGNLNDEQQSQIKTMDDDIALINQDTKAQGCCLGFKSRLVATVGVSAFGIGHALSNAFKAVVKTPAAVVLTLPQIAQAMFKFEVSAKDYSILAVFKHAFKTVAYVAMAAFSPLIGVFSPKAVLTMHHALGLDSEQVEKNDFSKISGAWKGQAKTVEDASVEQEALLIELQDIQYQQEAEPIINKMMAKLDIVNKFVADAQDQAKVAKDTKQPKSIVALTSEMANNLSETQVKMVKNITTASTIVASKPSSYIEHAKSFLPSIETLMSYIPSRG